VTLTTRIIEKLTNRDRPVLSSGFSSNPTGFLTGTGSGSTSQLSAHSSVGWLFQVVNRIATSVAEVEWNLYQRTSADERTLLPITHPAMELWNRPSPFYTNDELVETTSQHLELTGEGWWILVPSIVGGPPVEIWPVRPDRMTPMKDRKQYVSGYIYRFEDTEQIFEPDAVVFLRMPSPLDPHRGAGPVQSLLVDIDSEQAAREWTRNFFRNDAAPGGIIELDQTLDDAQWSQFVERWREQHAGVANAHRVAVIERGKWADRKITQREMQFEQLRRLNRDVILGAFGVHASIMGISENVNRANAEAAEVHYARHVIRPRLRRIRAVLNEQIAPMFADGIEYDFVDPVPADQAHSLTVAVAGFEKGILKLNESRDLLGFPAVEDEDGGDEFRRPSPSPILPEVPVEPDIPEPEEPEEEERSFEPVAVKAPEHATSLWPEGITDSQVRMERAWARRLAAEIDEIMRVLTEAEKGVVKLGPSDLDGYDWDWFGKYGVAVSDELAEAFASAARFEHPSINPTDLQKISATFAEERGAQLLRIDGDLNLANATRARVNEIVSEAIANGDSLGKVQKSLRDDFQFSRARAAMVARTESATALGQGMNTTARMQGRDEKRWTTQGDDRVSEEICLPNEAAGWLGMEELFPSEHMMIPGHINCRCVTRYRTAIKATSEVRCPNPNCRRRSDVQAGHAEVRCRRCRTEFSVVA